MTLSRHVPFLSVSRDHWRHTVLLNQPPSSGRAIGRDVTVRLHSNDVVASANFSHSGTLIARAQELTHVVVVTAAFLHSFLLAITGAIELRSCDLLSSLYVSLRPGRREEAGRDDNNNDVANTFAMSL